MAGETIAIVSMGAWERRLALQAWAKAVLCIGSSEAKVLCGKKERLYSHCCPAETIGIGDKRKEKREREKRTEKET